MPRATGVSRGLVEALRLTTMVAIALMAATVYTARGDSHDTTTFYACLFAGSLTQVSTSEPVNCGRGTPVSWNAAGVPGLDGNDGKPGLSGLTSVSVDFNETFSANIMRLFVAKCEDGLVPISGGHFVNEPEPYDLHLVASRAVAGSIDNPFNFPTSSQLSPGEYAWQIAFRAAITGNFSGSAHANCASIEPPEEI